MKKQVHIELVKDFDGSYYANVYLNGELVKGLPEYVSYREIKRAVREKLALIMPPLSAFNFEPLGHKKYAYLDGIV